MNNYILATVPHTGTVFAEGMLRTVGQVGSAVKQWHWKADSLALPSEPRVLVTARDPYLSVIRFLYSGEPFESACSIWNTFLECKDFVDHFVLDVGCRKEDRFDHLCAALDFCEVDYSAYTDALVSYADEWKPANTSEEYAGDQSRKHFRTEYLETGKLPDGYDWDKLDAAVAWYKSLPTNDYV